MFNPLLKLKELGQSVWLDFLSRKILASGQIQQLIEQDGLSGVTSNPAIFKKAITDSQTYDQAIRHLLQQKKSVTEIYQILVVEDIQWTADVLRSVYNQSNGEDGFVSLEVSPHLAYDTEGTIAEARRLWAAVDRPNLFIKVPATQAGLPAIQQLISEGINVNVTLLFGLPRYRAVAQAYLAGLEARAKAGQSLVGVRSVASFFLSRIDVLVDARLEEIITEGGPNAPTAAKLRGQVAIASAKAAYQIYQDIFKGEPFRRLEQSGATAQCLLWASTSTKNPEYSDVKYVEALIGPETVNTMPLETLEAYRDHGKPERRLEKGLGKTDDILESLSDLNIRIDEVTQQLEAEGVQKFIEPYDELMAVLQQQHKQYEVAAVPN